MARVLDLTGHAAVYATRLFAELGYDVVRVESPAGDEVRRQGPFLGGEPDLDDGAYHQFFNAGKRSVALDVRTAAGREAFARLAATADVIVAGASGAYAEAELRALAPAATLVLTLNDASCELCAYARSGLLSITGHVDRAPYLMGGHIIYAATGLWVMIAAEAAVLVRKLTGTAETVRVDVQHCFESFLDHAIETFMLSGKIVQRAGALGSVTALAGALPSSDGFWMLSLVDSLEQWRTLVTWMDDPVLADDASLVKYEQRKARREELMGRIGAWASHMSKSEIVGEAQKRHIPASPVSTTLDLADDAQLIDRRFLVDIHHPQHGRMLFPRGALATVWGSTIAPAPTLGAHTGETLRELGYSEEEQALLFEQSVT